MSQQSFHQQTANGSNIAFTITTFSEDEIKVYVDGVESTNGGSSQNDYTIPNYTTTGGTVTWNTSGSLTAPASPSVVRVVRQTDVLNQGNTAVEGRATYSAGSSVKAADLNANTKQVLRALQEHNDQKIQTYDIDPDQITTTEIKDETIVNANVSTSAAIAGTKVTPAFGSQNVSTSGTAATGALTVTGNIAVSGTVDGRDVAADGSKLDGVDTGAKDDQTSTEIKSLLASDNLTDAHLAANSVGTSEIKDDAVTNDQLANSIVSSISANTSKTTNQTHTGDVTGSVALTISNDAVTTAKILNDNVTDDKLSHTSVTPASYGSSTSIPSFTVNQQGRITAASGNTVSFDVEADTSPSLGGNLDVENKEIITTTSNQDIVLTPNGSGAVTVKGTGSASGAIKFNSETNGRFIKLKAPANSALSQDYTFTLPVNDGDAGQFLKTDGIGTLSWDTVSGGGGGGGTAAPNNIVTLSESVDGSRTDFSMSVTPASAQNLIVSVNGVVQKPNAGTTIAGSAEGYCIDGATLKFATAPANGSSIFITEQSATVASDRITEGNSNVDVFDDNSTSRAVVNLDGNEKFRINEGGQIGLAGANYGTDGQVLTSQGSGAAAQWETIPIEVANDTSPQLGGNLDVQASEITTSTTNGNIKFTPNGTGVIEVKGAGGADGTLQLNCSQNSHGVKIKSPAHSAGASYTLTLPVNDGSANQVLKTDGSGVLAWVDQTTDTNTTDLVSDTSPQLGGTLDFNGYQISAGDSNGSTTNIVLLGASQDLKIYHDGTDSYFNNSTGAFLIQGDGTNNTIIRAKAGENSVVSIPNGAVELYYDDSKKFETRSNGVMIGGSSGDQALNIAVSDNISQSRIIFSDATNTDGIITYDHNDRKLHLGAGTTAATDGDLTIDSSGRVLIGTTTEGHASADDLTIANSGAGGITIRSGTSNDGNLWFSDGTSGTDEYRGYVQYEHANDAFNFGTASSTRLKIDNAGRVLIGATTTLPAWGQNNRLQVTGSDWNTAGGQFGIIGGNNQGPNLIFAKTRGSSPGTAVVDNDWLMVININGDDGTDIATTGAAIKSQVNGTVASNRVDADLQLHTHYNGTLAERVRVHPTGEVTIPAGITLGTAVTSNVVSNTLHDYEEGTWTPAHSSSGGSVASSGTYTNQHGTYTKIGDRVHISGYLGWNNNWSGGSGSYAIDLPFTQNNSPATYCSISIGFLEHTGGAIANANESVGGYISSNKILFYRIPTGQGTGSNGGGSVANATWAHAAGYIQFNLTMRV